MKLNAMIDFWARLKPEAPAIITFDLVITYQALSAATGTGVSDRGLL